MIFNEYKLESLCSKIGDGIHGTPVYDDDGDYYFINGNNLVNGKIVIKEDTKKINEIEYEKNKRDLNDRTLLISINGTIGNIARYNNEPVILGKSACYINLKSDVNIDYIRYYFMSDEFQNYLVNYANGSTIKNVPLSAIRNCVIKVPSREIQEKIVKIISSIEDKIENCEKLNIELFSLAHSLYKKLFILNNINLSDINNDCFDNIPENWNIGYIGDNKYTSIIKSGVTEYENTKRYLATADVEGSEINSFSDVTYNEKPSRANMTPIDNSVWFAKMENSNKNILVMDYMDDLINNYIFSTGFMGVKCLKNTTYYMWHYINDKSFVDKKNKLSTGTLMAGISNTTISGCKYLIPDEETLKKFNLKVSSIEEKIYLNKKMINKLIILIKSLITKLLTSNINIEEINI